MDDDDQIARIAALREQLYRSAARRRVALDLGATVQAGRGLADLRAAVALLCEIVAEQEADRGSLIALELWVAGDPGDSIEEG